MIFQKKFLINIYDKSKTRRNFVKTQEKNIKIHQRFSLWREIKRKNGQGAAFARLEPRVQRSPGKKKNFSPALANKNQRRPKAVRNFLRQIHKLSEKKLNKTGQENFSPDCRISPENFPRNRKINSINFFSVAFQNNRSINIGS